MNPLHKEEMDGVMAANVLMGHDKDCRTWLKANRTPTADDANVDEGRRRRREGRRRRERVA